MDDAFQEWWELVEEMDDAPDAPGWMRQSHGSCKLRAMGFSKDATLSAAYELDFGQGIPGGKGDVRQSVGYETGNFVNAPGRMDDGETKSTRCPMPSSGEVELEGRSGTLYATRHSCQDPGGVDVASLGYFKIVRGLDYHGIETGAAFAIAEMGRFTDPCPTTGRTRWSECSACHECCSQDFGDMVSQFFPT